MKKVLKTLATLLLIPGNLVIASGCVIYEICEEFVYDMKNIWKTEE